MRSTYRVADGESARQQHIEHEVHIDCRRQISRTAGAYPPVEDGLHRSSDFIHLWRLRAHVMRLCAPVRALAHQARAHAPVFVHVYDLCAIKIKIFVYYAYCIRVIIII